MTSTITLSAIKDALRCGNSGCTCAKTSGNVHCPAHDDDAPSLTVHERDGKVLVHCHSGCEQESVVTALKARGLWPELKATNGKRRPPHAGPPIAIYDYTDKAGQLLYQVLRFPNWPDGKKDFCQRKPARVGEWTYRLGDVEHVPYRLPELIMAVSQGMTILIPEGEKDVENLRQIGCKATCNAGGAGKWQAYWSGYFTGAKVVILPDNDAPGEKHSEMIAESLHGVARSVKLVKLPGLQPKGDVTDWLEAGHSLDDLVTIIKAASEYVFTALEQFPLTEFGDAEQLVADHGQDIRYCEEIGDWFVWDGIAWRPHGLIKIIARGKETIRSIYQRAIGLPEGHRRAELLKHALCGERAAHVRNMEVMARSEHGMSTARKAFDSDPMLLNTPNGTVNLRNGQLLPSHREDLITMVTGYEYDITAICPTWTRFLVEVLPNPDIRAFVQRACGYALSGDTSEQCFFFLHGAGANGKSTMINALLAIMGDYGLQATSDLLLAKKGDRVPADIAELNKRRLVATIEIDDGRRMAEGLVKQMTGGEDIRARFLYQGFFQFKPTHKVFMAANHKPVITGTDMAIWRRVMLIPFDQTILDENRDMHLGEKLAAEGPGILRWCVDGCLEWQECGLQPPATVKAAVASYRIEQDIVGQFIEAVCITRSGISCNATRLYQAYREWCNKNNERELTHTAFGLEMKSRGFGTIRNRSGKLNTGIDIKGEGMDLE